MRKKIAIVEDEISIEKNYRDALTRHGFDVARYADRPTAMAAFTNRLPYLAIIDVGLKD